VIGLALAWLAIGAGFALLSKRVRSEVYDVVEFHWSRFRAHRRLPSARVPSGPASLHVSRAAATS